MFVYLIALSAIKGGDSNQGVHHTHVSRTTPRAKDISAPTQIRTVGQPNQTPQTFKILLVGNENFYRNVLAEYMTRTFQDNPDGNSYEIVHAAYMEEVEEALQQNNISLVISDDFGTNYNVEKVAEATKRLSQAAKIIVYDYNLVIDDIPEVRRQELNIIDMLNPAFFSARQLAQFVQSRLTGKS